MQRTLLLALALVFLGSMLTGSAAWARSTDISWSPKAIELQLFPGTSSGETVTFTSSQNLTDVSLWIVPELQGFVTVEPQSFHPIGAGVEYPATLLISVPSDTALGTFEGTLHIKVGKRTLAQPLKIILNVEEPTVEDIPATVALPSWDRIYEDPETGAEFVTDEILIGFAPGTSEDIVSDVVMALGGIFLGSIPGLDLYQIQFPSLTGPRQLEGIIEQLEAQPEVEIAMRSWIHEVRSLPSEGRDPRWDDWDEENPLGNNWAHEFIKLPSAWDYTTGSGDIKIGVVDVGFDIEHEDLRSNVDLSVSALSVHAHGTSVLGIIGAEGNNEVGISGVMWDATLLPYCAKVPFTEKSMHVLYSIGKMWLAIEAGAKIINYSGGTDYTFLWLADRENDGWRFLLNRIKDKDILFIFAAGQTSVDDKYSSPSSLSTEYDNVISVTASAWLISELSYGSNFGDISVAAPGERIYSTLPSNNYGFNMGTSFAAPLVSGLAGLIWSLNPDLTAAQVKNLIIQGAINGGRYAEGPNGHRIPIINAYESLRLAYETFPATITRVWTSDSARGPEVTEFPAGTKDIYVNYAYENPIGSVHKIIWYNNEGKAMWSGEHIAEHVSGIGTWSLPYPGLEFWPAGSYSADLFINDILLVSVGWIVQPPTPAITRAWTSDSIRGPEITEFPAGTEEIYVNYEYQNLIGSIQKITWYDNEGKVMGSHVHESEHVSGIGTWGLTYPGQAFWPGGSYRADLFINDILLATVTWTVQGPTYRYESLDYFKITEGHGIKYHVTDDYHALDCNAWAVSQYLETYKPHELDFVFTLIKEGTEGGYFRNSSMGGEVSRGIEAKDLPLFYLGYPVGNQANFYLNLSLPRFFNSGDEWSVGDREYNVEYVGSQTVNGIEFSDCIKVTIDDSLNDADYLRGTGYFILARDIGIVKLVFNRMSGENVLYEYVEHDQLTRHTISGTINDGGVPVEAIIVQISNANWGTRSVTNSNGVFSIQAYGPDIVLRIGYDKDNDDIFDFDDPNYPREYCVNSITSDISGLVIDIHPPYYASAHSAHFASGYYVELMVDDPNQLIQSVTVTGPGIDGSLSLVSGIHPFYPHQWWSRPNVSLGTTPPSLPLVYTFTITDKTGAIYIVTDDVQRYVESFATNLSPASNEIVTGELVFSWTGIDIPEARYMVQLSDGEGNRIWDSPLTTNTYYVYDGPTLSSGTYQYFVSSRSKYGDESLAYETFRYALTLG